MRSKCSASAVWRFSVSWRALCGRASTKAANVLTRIVAFAVFDIPSKVRSPKQFPICTSASTPNAFVSMLQRPYSRTYSVPCLLPSSMTISPHSKVRREHSLASSLTNFKSHCANSRRLASTSVRVGNSCCKRLTVAMHRSLRDDTIPGNKDKVFKSSLAGNLIQSTVVLARTVAARGIEAPMRAMSPIMAPARSRPICVVTQPPEASPMCFSTVAMPLSMTYNDSPASPVSPSFTTTFPASTEINSHISAMTKRASGGASGNSA
mmetsp:Transcript_82794/g.155873  ORF Transcript_82794/g.155873 Transcript_82794/m.155873 type:complete len:265 (-) Transcript_82794:20-814(-)